MPFTMGEILSFSQFNLQISLAMLTTATAFLYSKKYIESGNRKNICVIFLLMVYSLGTYQAMLCVYATAVAADCLLHCVIKQEKGLFKRLFRYACLCIISTLLYLVIGKLLGYFIGQSSYLNHYIEWTSDNVPLAAALAIANIGRVSFAIPYNEAYIYGGEVIRCVTIMFVIYSVWLFIKRKGITEKLRVMFWTIALCVAPFVLYLILLTHATAGRMLLGLPLAGAIQLYLIFEACKGKVYKYVVTVITSYLLFLNACNMNQIYYYSTLAYKWDYSVASDIMRDIQRAGMDYHTKPLAFIGMVEMEEIGNLKSCNLGSSDLEWDSGSNARILCFIKDMGYNVAFSGSDELAQALIASKDMPLYPREGSIQELDNVIVIHLSEPTEEWYKNNAMIQKE